MQECSICITEMTVLDSITILHCGHNFHSLCFSKWRSMKCPECRRENSEKVDISHKINKRFLEWSGEDFYDYSVFIRTNPEIINRRKAIGIQSCIKELYSNSIQSIRFIVLKNINDGKTNFMISSFGRSKVFNGHPYIFLVAGPLGGTYFKENKIKSLKDILNSEFKNFHFYIKKDFHNFELKVKINFTKLDF